MDGRRSISGVERRRTVRETYDRIAEHFAATREYAWPEVEAFVEETPLETDGLAVGLDVGCGNCRHAELLAERCDRVVGLDVSRGLLETGRERSLERGFGDALALVQGEAAALPLRRDAVDLGVYVATLHHLPTRDARVASLAELERVLAPGGRPRGERSRRPRERSLERELLRDGRRGRLSGRDRRRPRPITQR